MPETTMYKNDSLLLTDCNVWNTGKVAPVQTEAKPHSVKESSDNDLWACVLRPNASHVLTAPFCAQVVQRYYLDFTAGRKVKTADSRTEFGCSTCEWNPAILVQ